MTTTDHSIDRELALVTGASSGIGLELARELARRGYDLIVAAEDDRIRLLPAELDEVTVTPVQTDLATRAGNDELLRTVAENRAPLSVAAINAGIGVGGPLVETSTDDHLRLVELNVASTVQLGKEIATRMVEQGHGKMLFTSSVASQMPGPLNTTYAASKSFVQSFAEGLHQELEPNGVTVTALMPGPTDTEFFERADLEDTKIGQGSKDDPSEVAAEGLDAMDHGRDHVVAGSTSNTLQAALAALLPDSVKAKLHETMNAPKE
jgi:short-subunit dehydrogenase